MWNLIRWVSPRTIKETLVPPPTTATRSSRPTATGSAHRRRFRRRGLTAMRGDSTSRRAAADTATGRPCTRIARRDELLGLPVRHRARAARARDRLPPAEVRLHEPRVAERPRRRVSRSRRCRWPPILAAYVAGVGVNADLPGARRRRRADLPRPPRHPRQLVHDPRHVDRGAHARRHDARRSPLFVLGAHAGPAPVARLAPRLPRSTLAGLFDDAVVRPGGADRARRDRRRRRAALQRYWIDFCAIASARRSPSSPPDAVPAHRRPLAARRLGAALHDDLVLPRRVRDPPDDPQRASRAGDAKPRHARPATPGGIGTEQAFLIYVVPRRGVGRSTLLAFSVGMRLTLTVVNVIVGFAAILLTLGTVRFQDAVRRDARRTGTRHACALTAPRPDPPCAAGRTRRAPSSPAARARPRAPPVTPQEPLRRAEVAAGSPAGARGRSPRARRRSTRRRACPAAGGGARARSGAPRPGSAAGAAGPASCRSSRIGSAPAGDEHLLLALRERDHRHPRQVVRRGIASRAAASWPLPPSITTRFGTVREALVAAVGRRGVAQAREAPRDDLRHRREVVLALEPAHAERAVVRPPRLAVHEHRHRGHDLAPLDVRDVEALDPDRQALEVQALTQLLQRLDPPLPLLLGRESPRARARDARSPRRARRAAASRRVAAPAPRRARRAARRGTRRGPRCRRCPAARRSAAAPRAPRCSTRGRTTRGSSRDPARRRSPGGRRIGRSSLPSRSGKSCTAARSPSTASPITSIVPTARLSAAWRCARLSIANRRFR